MHKIREKDVQPYIRRDTVGVRHTFHALAVFLGRTRDSLWIRDAAVRWIKDNGRARRA